MKAAPYTEREVDLLLSPFRSSVMREIARTVGHIAASELSILIAGESGTGKEWLARRIHILSGRKQQPFVPVFCSMLMIEHAEQEIFGTEPASPGQPDTAGVFEQAADGTILFDDIANLPAPLQTMLAAALERQTIRRLNGTRDIPVTARIIATIDRKPDGLVAEGKLRKDLFYRISPIILEMPPLRQRLEDIPLLIDRLIVESNERHECAVPGMDSTALKLSLAYDWPGNIRELRNAIDYAVLMSRDAAIGPQSLPQYVLQGRTAGQSIAVNHEMNVASVEKLLIEQALNESRTKKQAAKRLGISLKTLYNKLSRYNLYDKFVNYTRNKTEIPEPGIPEPPAPVDLPRDMEPDGIVRY